MRVLGRDVAFAEGYLRIIHSINLSWHSLTARPGCVCSLSLMAQLAAHRHSGPVLDLGSLKINGDGQHMQQVDCGGLRLGHMGTF